MQIQRSKWNRIFFLSRCCQFKTNLFWQVNKLSKVLIAHFICTSLSWSKYNHSLKIAKDEEARKVLLLLAATAKTTKSYCRVFRHSIPFPNSLARILLPSWSNQQSDKKKILPAFSEKLSIINNSCSNFCPYLLWPRQ